MRLWVRSRVAGSSPSSFGPSCRPRQAAPVRAAAAASAGRGELRGGALTLAQGARKNPLLVLTRGAPPCGRRQRCSGRGQQRSRCRVCSRCVGTRAASVRTRSSNALPRRAALLPPTLIQSRALRAACRRPGQPHTACTGLCVRRELRARDVLAAVLSCFGHVQVVCALAGPRVRAHAWKMTRPAVL